MTEKRMSQLAVAGASSSLLLIGLVLFVLIGFADTASGNRELWTSVFFWQCLFVFLLYAASVYLVATAPGTNRNRRLLSWLVSVLFHGGAMAYVAVALDWGLVAFVPLMPEALVLFISCIALATVLREHAPQTARPNP